MDYNAIVGDCNANCDIVYSNHWKFNQAIVLQALLQSVLWDVSYRQN